MFKIVEISAAEVDELRKASAAIEQLFNARWAEFTEPEPATKRSCSDCSGACSGACGGTCAGSCQGGCSGTCNALCSTVCTMSGS